MILSVQDFYSTFLNSRGSGRTSCQVVRIGNRSPKWRWLKDKEGKSPRKQNKASSEDWNEDLRQNKQHSWLTPLTQARPRGRKKHIKGGAKALSLSLPSVCALFLSLSPLHPTPRNTRPLFPSSLCVDIPSHLEDGWSCYYLNKIELQHSCNTDLFESYNRVHLRPESCETPRALMSALQISVATRQN